ncbi:MAG: chromate resistance protein [Candidatus Accumulibacter sp.]|uniref:chromate resistance protein ChrB domain-containing protein n=1 Tax=Accumulibacter sp. TaxID=2053492 RepID=UPI00258B3614|nr:chromate resistance protein ChrB domain-containing protein [Accumulibacter sp.]MCM8621455.1 chromate resistance protein [Accumulibacter sp.]
MKWITRERPKVDRLACAWLIHRFIDKEPEFLFVHRDQVLTEAERLDAMPFDVPGVELGHRGPMCSFDAFIEKYRLDDPALKRLAYIVRGVDTHYPDLAAETSGLKAVVLGLNANIADDMELVVRSRPTYDALYAWCDRLVRPPQGILGGIARLFMKGRSR